MDVENNAMPISIRRQKAGKSKVKSNYQKGMQSIETTVVWTSLVPRLLSVFQYCMLKDKREPRRAFAHDQPRLVRMDGRTKNMM